MFKISPQTLGTLERASADQWDMHAASQLTEQYSDHFQKLGASHDDVTALCRIVRESAAAIDIRSRRDVLKLCILAVSLGVGFLDDPRFKPDIARGLLNKMVDPDKRMEAASDSALEWLTYLWNGTGLNDFGQRLDTILGEPEEDFSDREIVWKMLTFVVPGQMRLLTEDANVQFFADSFAFAQKQGLKGPVLTTAYTACAIVHGLRWLNDPQYGHLQSVFRTAYTQFELKRALGQFYGKFG